jgi:hypothetical protein
MLLLQLYKTILKVFAIRRAWLTFAMKVLG